MDRILRVDMSTLTTKEEPYPEEWAALGGRALSAKILLKEVDPKCDPLGPSNKLVFAPGCSDRHGRSNLGTHQRRGEEPAHARHQGSQFGWASRSKTGASRIPRRHHRGQAQRSRKALPAQDHQRRAPA